ncbi:hypothetical protein, partial [Vibrio sp. Vb2880]|uniref:hypothetical protein n=1 Tax=Vibrio sp. Vb2880 TaxID=2816076 RepID=UPI001F5D1501
QYIASFLKSDNPFYGNQVAQALLAAKNWNTLVIDSVLEDQTITGNLLENDIDLDGTLYV